ncbi:HXXEE domain-containing protein [Streptomyces sp. NPDC101455]|uniref:HXXEE domain-containing protein n=1 Tax=Streptomyces sp. NPDC101455 TaxID=3366142 RepID=UPI003829D8AD
MNFIRGHWYDIGMVLAVPAAVWALLGDLDTVPLILLLNFIVILLHQFEEYRFPGGEPWILNEVIQPKGGPADRYPLNQNNAAFINILAWAFYVVPIFFPGQVWLGLGQVLFGMVGQFVIHVVQTNIKLKSFYNPGQAAVLLGHVPLGIWYLIEVYGQNLISGWDWLFAVASIAFFIGVIMLRIGYGIMVDKNSPHPFTPAEMNRFGRLRRLRHAGITPLPLIPADAGESDRASA